MRSHSEWNQERTQELGVIEHEGKEFSAGGAFISPDYLICYPDDKGNVNAWDGTKLGTYRVTSSRPGVFFGHRSWIGERFYYMRATVNGRTYSLRGFGPGMVAKGKAARS